MDEKLIKLLSDIRSAISEIEFFLSDRDLGFESYEKDILLKRAIERELEIIGEAVSKIISINPDFPIENARKIIGLRNQIIHAYDNISDEMIWSVIINHIPKLKEEVDLLSNRN